eukprot:Blabericola_migrator_1__3212@NODE_1945_length_3520_cov_157_498697_g1243_i0_p3_GENE_NODE_1945_length_3520_cov_157_498697_g1243_i0NODE_1945_length_3520_cov_157_498697_g1243_i0_p3_ORF_typecomplete_len207_score37_15_NODE_1945_length_3520_cov_157_498697_g1243_i029003448
MLEDWWFKNPQAKGVSNPLGPDEKDPFWGMDDDDPPVVPTGELAVSREESKETRWSRVVQRRHTVEAAACLAWDWMIEANFHIDSATPSTSDIILSFMAFSRSAEPESETFAHWLLKAWRDLSKELHELEPNMPSREVLGEEYDKVLHFIETHGGWQKARNIRVLGPRGGAKHSDRDMKDEG